MNRTSHEIKVIGETMIGLEELSDHPKLSKAPPELLEKLHALLPPITESLRELSKALLSQNVNGIWELKTEFAVPAGSPPGSAEKETTYLHFNSSEGSSHRLPLHSNVGQTTALADAHELLKLVYSEQELQPLFALMRAHASAHAGGQQAKLLTINLARALNRPSSPSPFPGRMSPSPEPRYDYPQTSTEEPPYHPRPGNNPLIPPIPRPPNFTERILETVVIQQSDLSNLERELSDQYLKKKVTAEYAEQAKIDPDSVEQTNEWRFYRNKHQSRILAEFGDKVHAIISTNGNDCKAALLQVATQDIGMTQASAERQLAKIVAHRIEQESHHFRG